MTVSRIQTPWTVCCQEHHRTRNPPGNDSGVATSPGEVIIISSSSKWHVDGMVAVTIPQTRRKEDATAHCMCWSHHNAMKDEDMAGPCRGAHPNRMSWWIRQATDHLWMAWGRNSGLWHAARHRTRLHGDRVRLYTGPPRRRGQTGLPLPSDHLVAWMRTIRFARWLET
jgi:hypothetical protein